MPRHARPSDEIATAIPDGEEYRRWRCVHVAGPGTREQGVIVYLHGGSYVGGPMAQPVGMVGADAAADGAWRRWRCCIAWRRSTRSRPPSMTHLLAIRAMLAAGHLVAGRWVLAGDSAGGGLALATAQALRVAGDPMPTGLATVAPWVDLAMDHPDLLVGAPKEQVMGRSILRPSAERYANGVDVARSSGIAAIRADGWPAADASRYRNAKTSSSVTSSGSNVARSRRSVGHDD